MEPMEISVRALVWSLAQSDAPRPRQRPNRRPLSRALARARARGMALAGAALVALGHAALRASQKESPARR